MARLRLGHLADAFWFDLVFLSDKGADSRVLGATKYLIFLRGCPTSLGLCVGVFGSGPIHARQATRDLTRDTQRQQIN